MKFKVRDKVKIKDDLIVGNRYGDDIYINEMKDFCGNNILTIREIVDTVAKKGYKIENSIYFYTEEMLEPVEIKETIEVKLHNLTEDERKTLLDLVDKSNKKSRRFKPNCTDTYWFLKGTKVFSDTWTGHKLDWERYNTNNCFETQEEAEFMSKKKDITTQLEILALENNDEIDWYNDCRKYYLYYNYNLNELRMDYAYYCNTNLVYFTSKEVLIKAKEDIGEKNIVKYYFGTYKRS